MWNKAFFVQLWENGEDSWREAAIKTEFSLSCITRALILESQSSMGSNNEHLIIDSRWIFNKAPRQSHLVGHIWWGIEKDVPHSWPRIHHSFPLPWWNGRLCFARSQVRNNTWQNILAYSHCRINKPLQVSFHWQNWETLHDTWQNLLTYSHCRINKTLTS